MKIDTGIVTKGGKHIYTGDIVRPAKRSNWSDSELGEKWIVRLRDYPCVLVNVETGKIYDRLSDWYNGELVIIEHEEDSDAF